MEVGVIGMAGPSAALRVVWDLSPQRDNVMNRLQPMVDMTAQETKQNSVHAFHVHAQVLFKLNCQLFAN